MRVGMYVHVWMHTRTYVCAGACVCVSICICAHMLAHTHAQGYTRVYINVYTCTCIYVRAYACMCTCMCAHVQCVCSSACVDMRVPMYIGTCIYGLSNIWQVLMSSDASFNNVTLCSRAVAQTDTLRSTTSSPEGGVSRFRWPPTWGVCHIIILAICISPTPIKHLFVWL